MRWEEGEERKCMGARGRARLCTHVSIAFDEIVGLAERRWMVGEREVVGFKICGHEAHGKTFEERMLNAPVVGGQGESVVFTRSVVLAVVEKMEGVTQDVLRDALVKLGAEGEFVCEHVGMGDTESLVPRVKKCMGGEELEKLWRWPFYPALHDVGTPGCVKKGACRVCVTLPEFCKHTTCDTSWTVYRRHGMKVISAAKMNEQESTEEKDEIVLCVRRRFGRGHGNRLKPLDTNWMAQIDRRNQGQGDENEDHECLNDGKDLMDKYTDEPSIWDASLRAQGTTKFLLSLRKARSP